MLPCIRPFTVICQITDGIVVKSCTVIGSQQVTPTGIGVCIGDGICGSTQYTGGVGIFLLAQDIACIIVFPCPGFASLAVIFPDQLIGAVIGVLEKVGVRGLTPTGLPPGRNE